MVGTALDKGLKSTSDKKCVITKNRQVFCTGARWTERTII